MVTDNISVSVQAWHMSTLILRSTAWRTRLGRRSGQNDSAAGRAGWTAPLGAPVAHHPGWVRAKPCWLPGWRPRRAQRPHRHHRQRHASMAT